MRFRHLALILVSAMMFVSTSAKAILIDFEVFNVGDGLAQVNAVTTPLGATFDASPAGQTNGGPFSVFDQGGNQVITSGTWPPHADVLINFSTPVNFVQVTFVDNPSNTLAGVSIIARDKTGTAAGILSDLTATIVGSDTGMEPDVLSITASGILSLQLESGSGVLYFDDIVFTPVPEPGTLSLVALGLVGLGFAARKRAA